MYVERNSRQLKPEPQWLMTRNPGSYSAVTEFRGENVRNLRILEALTLKGLLANLFPTAKILHLHLETMPIAHLSAFAVDSYINESKVLLSLVSIQPHNITATPW